MTKGTILYVGGFELPDRNAAAHRVLGNAKAMRALGYAVALLGVCKDRELSQNVLVTKSTVDGFEYWSVRYPEGLRERVVSLHDISALKIVCSAIGNVTAVVCYNYPAFAMLKALRHCRENGIRLLGDCTEWYEMADVNGPAKLVKWLDTTLRMRALHKRLDGLIVISSYLEQYYAKCRNVIVVPPLVDLSERKWQAGIADGGSKVPVHSDGGMSAHGPIRLVCAGGTLGGRNKDTVDHLLEAMHSLGRDAFALQVVGMTRDDYLRDYPEHDQLLRDLGEAVDFRGRMSHVASVAQVRNADFSVILRNKSRKNDAGFPTKFVESLACGTPVIATDTSDLGRYLQDGRNGFWTSNDPEVLRTTLQRIAALDRAALDRMKADCRCLDAFDYHQYISGFGSLIARLGQA